VTRVALLDVNETLSDMEPLRARFERVGVSPRLLDAWFAGTLRDGMALTASGAYADFADIARAVLRPLLGGQAELSVPLDEAVDDILAGFRELPVHPDVEPGLRRLHDGGVRLATLTNGSTAIAEGLLGRAGLSELIERFLDVTEVRLWKPHPKPYHWACETLGVSPVDAVLIAVHPWDIHGAKRAGLRAAWLDRRGTGYPDVFDAPDLTGADLPELAEHIPA
jgi:2-haloacid dehalogenase